MSTEAEEDHHHDALHHACSYTFHHGDPKDRWFFATDAVLAQVKHAHDDLVSHRHLVSHALFARAHAATPGAEKDDIYKPEVMKTIEDEIDSFDAALRDINLKLHSTSCYPVPHSYRKLNRIIRVLFIPRQPRAKVPREVRSPNHTRYSTVDVTNHNAALRMTP